MKRTFLAPTIANRRHPRLRRNEFGVVLIETALCSLLLCIFALGIAEYGYLFGSAIDVSTSVRSAARAGSATASEVITDDVIIAAALDTPNGGTRNLSKIIIWNATATGPNPPAECLTATSSTGVCNVYGPADFGKTAAQLDAISAWHHAYRQPGSDFIGVWVGVDRSPLQELVWSPKKYSDSATMMIEAKVVASAVGGVSTGFNVGSSTLDPPQSGWFVPDGGGGTGSGGSGGGGIG